jgi:hypothetical protein
LATNFFLPRAIHKSQHLRQQWALAAANGIAVSIVDGYASLRRNGSAADRQPVADRIALLRQLPYAFNFGTLPVKTGDSEAFRARVEAVIIEKVREHSALFPLLCSVGVTMGLDPVSTTRGQGPVAVCHCDGLEHLTAGPVQLPHPRGSRRISARRPWFRRRIDRHYLTVVSVSGLDSFL